MIPGQMTSLLQPLYISVNKPFKDSLWRCRANWMMEGEKSYTMGGWMQKVDLPTICLWLLKVWDKLPAEIIRRAFLKWSNSLDGTEDDVLWEDDSRSTSESDDSDADLL